MKMLTKEWKAIQEISVYLRVLHVWVHLLPLACICMYVARPQLPTTFVPNRGHKPKHILLRVRRLIHTKTKRKVHGRIDVYTLRSIWCLGFFRTLCHRRAFLTKEEPRLLLALCVWCVHTWMILLEASWTDADRLNGKRETKPRRNRWHLPILDITLQFDMSPRASRRGMSICHTQFAVDVARYFCVARFSARAANLSPG